MNWIEGKKIWFNGEFVDWKDAKINVLSHVVHYGSSIFEGLRCYSTPQGPAVFRLQDHTRRMFDSAKIYRMEIPYTQDEFNEAIVSTVGINKFDSCYIRPIVFRGFAQLGVNPLNCPVDCVVAAWTWGSYVSEEALEKGADVCTSSWNRMRPNTLPALAKAGGNYLNSQLIKMEALANGYEEGIALDHAGLISEGSGENLFLVRDGVLYTTPRSASILGGITRDSIMVLAKDMGIEVVEENIPREMLYIADEVFFSGTAAEITPIRSVDRIQVGAGKRGPITEKLQKAFFDIANGKVEDRHSWLTHVK
ncbi:MAG: branched-chain amino acid transaminase [Limnochordia bacterium]|jgi:branched-chain amino acid aminotransferase|nr:branched-chain amino acid transaminase [Limnochordia bacterium]MDD2629218.1 branched-chain amino acid transaminase [Limnochordia bacterium]MDD4517653.1 branched-chain amino acid transaminase [Limnochordia bacterium]